MIEKKFRVDGMHCLNCAMRVESIEDDLPGIKQASASYHKGQIYIKYDETQVNEAQIETAVKELGYQLIPI